MKTRIIIARHGNTFISGETPRRVGGRTDIPLVEEKRGKSIGKYLKENDLIPDKVFAAPLLRTVQTAKQAIEAMGLVIDVDKLEMFTEVNYGPDENKTEEEVMYRLGNGDIEKGKSIINQWNSKAVIPEGWEIDPKQILDYWFEFANNIVQREYKGKNVLLVSSNGIIRFAPYLTGDFIAFSHEHDIKVSTGGICIFEKEETCPFWTCTAWNIKPYEIYY